jgi:hypothetical protein
MSRGIFLIQHDNRLVELREQAYDSETLLQELLARHPSLLSGDQIDPDSPRRWLLVRREAPVPGEQGGGGRWSVDHLFLDQDAIPTLVEVKRSSDTRIRREVVGQMLDYAANAVLHWPVEHLIEQFETACRARGADPDQEIASLLGPEADPAAFWEQVKTNLRAGKVRMLFVADEIPTELRRVVEFLNQQMDPAEVLAMEVKQFVSEGLRTLVPTVIGHTGKQPLAQRRQWDEATFFEDLSKRKTALDVTVARALLKWGRERGLRVLWGKGRSIGSFFPVLDFGGESHQAFLVYSYGLVEIPFAWYAYKTPFDDEGRRMEMLHRLNAVPGIALPENFINNRRPSVPLSALAPEANLERFLAVFDWYLEQIRAAASAPEASDAIIDHTEG